MKMNKLTKFSWFFFGLNTLNQLPFASNEILSNVNVYIWYDETWGKNGLNLVHHAEFWHSVKERKNEKYLNLMQFSYKISALLVC